MKILGIECSSKAVGCAISENENIIYSSGVEDGKTHSQTLMPLINEVIKKSNISVEDIDLFGISAGPGSFTGLRIGIASVKGLAFVDNTPCVPLSSLEIMANTATGNEDIIVPMIDARVGRVYSALFEKNEDKITRRSEDKIWDLDNLLETVDQISKNSFFLCDKSDLCYNILDIKKACEAVCKLSYARYNEGKFVLPENLLPVYLAKPQAQRERERRTLK
ncbi:MAG: tRNA (adenosine(37)-N6)-threonylcarbamoyltransferase complex dimerization subunit type 1 TsaB [Clostridia bacterium]|nr:tRNA (adenosine(37)-N6)-threonylcarbamoyltransferase complex dimerization subunit type 1 TsaB [Clostridia bacterium]